MPGTWIGPIVVFSPTYSCFAMPTPPAVITEPVIDVELAVASVVLTTPPAVTDPVIQINAPVPVVVLAVVFASVSAPSVPIAEATAWIVLPDVLLNKGT